VSRLTYTKSLYRDEMGDGDRNLFMEVRGRDRKHPLVTEYEIERLLPVL
jgi:hypothetical protein